MEHDTNPVVERHSVKSDDATPEGESDNLGDATSEGYGTCTASVAYGNIGIMIQGTLVSIKAFKNDGNLDILMIFNAIEKAVSDIYDHGRRGRSVIYIDSESIIYQMTFVHNNLHIII
jgi:hypothetical protein